MFYLHHTSPQFPLCVEQCSDGLPQWCHFLVKDPLIKPLSSGVTKETNKSKMGLRQKHDFFGCTTQAVGHALMHVSTHILYTLYITHTRCTLGREVRITCRYHWIVAKVVVCLTEPKTKRWLNIYHLEVDGIPGEKTQKMSLSFYLHKI